MNAPAYPAVLDTLDRGAPVNLTPVGGGCIANAGVARFSDGSEVFVKTHQGAVGMFEAEAAGLQALNEAGAIRIPEVLAVDSGALVLEAIRSAGRCAQFSTLFGRRFAQLHRRQAAACGFAMDNFIGATPQPNEPLAGDWESAPDQGGADWPEFFIERRLRFQADLAARNGHGHELQRLLDQAENRIDDALSEAIEPPSLLHGDLWGGNYIVDELGEPCLIDPAVYFGHREADLAMTRLFGGFDANFYTSYDEAFPLTPGSGERLPIYQLYHVINHLNLFGGSYYAQCLSILRNLVR